MQRDPLMTDRSNRIVRMSGASAPVDVGKQFCLKAAYALSCWGAAAICVVGMLIGLSYPVSALAQVPVVIDDWSEDQRVNTAPPDRQRQGGSINDGVFPGSILGNWRNVYVEAFSSTAATTFRSVPAERNATFNNESGATGLMRIFWDGSRRYLTADTQGAGTNNPDDPLPISNGVLQVNLGDPNANPPDLGTTVDPTGLNGINVRQTCHGGASDGIHMLFGTTDQGDVTATVHIFSAADEWSVATNTQNDGTPRVLSFFFDGDPSESNVFSPGGGPDGDKGAVFTNVGAIVLSLRVDTAAVDVPYATPILLGCGLDFADAPIRHDNVSLNRVSYRTESPFRARQSFFQDGPNLVALTNFADPETRSFRGPHHGIGGPFLGLGPNANDTDAEDDGQPNNAATGDDLDGNDDEQGVNLSNLGLSEASTGLDPAELQTCAGITMGSGSFETTYCAEVFVSNPTDRWAQVVGWVDFNGNGAFDNRCGGVNITPGPGQIGPLAVIADGTVTYSKTIAQVEAGDFVNEDAFCERSSYRVLLGDLREHGSGFYPQATGTSPVGFRQIPGAAGICDTGAFSVGGAVNQGTSDGGAEPVAGWANGNVPPGCEGVVVLTWDVGNIFDEITLGETFSRFRISTDPLASGETGCGFLQESGPTPFCFASDGEVEDHRILANQLPVSIHAFESRWTSAGLEVVWGTVSETENEGFYIWGYDGEELHLLTREMIPSEAVDIVSPQRYQYLINDPAARSMQSLAITAVDIFGDEEMYGFFAIGGQFGREQATSPIDWASISRATEQALEQQALFGERARSNLGPVIGADFRVSEPGMHRITYEQLAAAGMDFAGVNPNHIAVTRAGKPIARFASAQRGPIGGSRGSAAAAGNQFGPGSFIEFWGELPAIPDSLYVEEYVYRVSVDRSSAVAGRQVAQRVGAGDALPYHLGSFFLNEDNDYNMSNRLPDPWYAARLRTRPSSARTFETDVFVGPQFQPGSAGRLELVVMGGIGHEVSPAHHVRVFLNDVEVYDVKFERLSRYDIRAEIPAGLIQPGSNRVRVFLPGGTEAPSDIVFLDTIELFYPREFALRDGRLLVQEAEVGERVQVAGAPARSTPTVYAWDGSDLMQLRSRERFSRDVVFRTLEEEGLQYWISTADAVLEPEMVGPVHDLDLLAEAADFLVIAHPAFMPLSDSDLHPLNDFVRQRSLDGWSVRVVDVTEIQQQFGGGMPLPQAVQSFLGAASQAFDPSHVLLVGGDSYDYHDRLGLGSLSFIPTFYAATSRVRHTPADGLLADLNGNGVADLAIGRWPVRTHADLESIVTKTLDWEASVADLRSAVWVADSQDPSQPSFAGQIDRMLGTLTGSGWNEGNMSRILIDEMSVSDARHQLFDKIESGATFTGFVGHGAPSMWTFQGLLVPDDLAELRNEGRPTLISTSTCYTSYFVSPFSDTVAHRWMNGFRLDANGAPVPGSPNGAVAIHGAATLSNFAQNEFIVGQAQSGMLQGMTLGEAVRAARAAGGNRGLRDQVTNWILLGDPTLRLAD